MSPEKYIFHPQKNVLRNRIINAFNSLAKGQDAMIVEGTGHAGVGSVIDFSNADVASLLGSKVIIVSEGGIGKVIASTAIVKRIKEEFPSKRLIVVTGYPDIFLHNPHVYRVFRFDNPLYFYDDYVTPESYVIKVEPYVSY